MKPISARRRRIKLAAPAVAFCCTALTVLAGTFPASAAQPQAVPAKTIEGTVTMGAARALPARAMSQLAAKPSIGSAQCAPAPHEFDRTNSCTDAVGTITFLVDDAPVGSMVFTLEQSIHLKANSKDWIENDTITKLVAIEEVPDVVDVTMKATCGPPCKATAHFSGVLRTGLKGTVSYTDNVRTNTAHQTETTYTLDTVAPGFVPGPSPEWKSGLEYRCDQNKAVKGTGCVFAEYTPTLILSHRSYGAAAYMIAWAQAFMHKHWGLESAPRSPTLTRATSTQGRANRRKICNSTFHNAGTVVVNGGKNDRDSCDEFPFASTGQSGASHVSGQSCVQLKAVHNTTKGNEQTQWSTTVAIGTPNLNADCVRAHIPGRENSAVGGAYGAFIKNNRLFYGEKFWVLVTT